MKKIETLVEDIYQVLEGKTPLDLPDHLAEAFGKRMVEMVSTRIGRKSSEATVEFKPKLRMSNLGKPCERQVYLQIHYHKDPRMEDLRGETFLKFLYGDVIEELILFLAEAAGHTVTGMQDQMELEGVVGHRDAVIDGVLVDVKSASSYSFIKFREGKLVENDPFGYIGQIQSYLEASQDDDLVTDKNRCAFLVMDKTLGHLCLDIHNKVPFDVREITRRKVKVMESVDLPDRGFQPEPDGMSGNMKLPMTCSYCSAKSICHDNIRTFLYSNGPRYLTTVKKLPNVTELT